MNECKKCRIFKPEDQFDKRKHPGRYLTHLGYVPLKKWCRECCEAKSKEFKGLLEDIRKNLQGV
jgi:hypothetical protein